MWVNCEKIINTSVIKKLLNWFLPLKNLKFFSKKLTIFRKQTYWVYIKNLRTVIFILLSCEVSNQPNPK